jgi:hypothetical protein
MKQKSIFVLFATIILICVVATCYYGFFKPNSLSFFGYKVTKEGIYVTSITLSVIFTLHMYYNLPNTHWYLDGLPMPVGAAASGILAMFSLFDWSAGHYHLSLRIIGTVIGIVAAGVVFASAANREERMPKIN